METMNQLTLINEVERDPQEIVDQAKRAADVLTSVVKMKKNPVIFNGEQYLEYEDWQTLGRFYGVTAKIESTSHVKFGDIEGFEARAVAVHAQSQSVVSSAEAMCLNDEPHWTERKGSHVPLFQLRSMAQTRACAKALRGCLSWIAVLAGYRATPAEEMTGEEVANAVGPVEEYAFSIEKSETSGQYGKAIEYWNRWKEIIEAGLCETFTKKSSKGKDLKAFRTSATNLDLSKPLKAKAKKEDGADPTTKNTDGHSQMTTSTTETNGTTKTTPEQMFALRDKVIAKFACKESDWAKTLDKVAGVKDVNHIADIDALMDWLDGQGTEPVMEPNAAKDPTK